MTWRVGGFGGYAVAISVTGLIVYLQLVPNIVWLARPPANDVLEHNTSTHAALNLTEQAFGIATVALLIIMVSRVGTRGHNTVWLLVAAGVFLVTYYAAWVLYYRGNVSGWLLVLGIAAMPPLYFFCAAAWMKNYVALVPCAVFGMAHVTITWASYVH
jgi:hypothetical protein